MNRGATNVFLPFSFFINRLFVMFVILRLLFRNLVLRDSFCCILLAFLPFICHVAKSKVSAFEIQFVAFNLVGVFIGAYVINSVF